MSISGLQSRLARTALGLSNAELAKLAGVGVNTVSRFETGQDVRMSSVGAIRAALEARGAVFVGIGQTAPVNAVGIAER